MKIFIGNWLFTYEEINLKGKIEVYFCIHSLYNSLFIYQQKSKKLTILTINDNIKRISFSRYTLNVHNLNYYIN
jgi:hypothetical protein